MFVNLTGNIPLNSRICIYGSLKVGIFLKRFLELTRKDVKIVCFLDSFKSGIIDNLKIINIADIKEIESEYDLIVITSSNIHAISDILQAYNIQNYTYIHTEAFKWLVNFIDDVIYFEHSSNMKISEDFIKNNSAMFEKARSVFESAKDRELYDLAIKSRCNKESFDKLSEYIIRNFNLVNTQYFEFINKDAIKVVFDCGAYDGATVVKFLNNFAKAEKVYAFEPLYKIFARKPFSTTIHNSDKIEMFEYALWDCKKTFQFKNQNGGSRIDFLVNPDPLNNSKKKFKDIETEVFHSVQTISIDEFMQENNINELDFAKFDIEGAELCALKGAKNSLIKHRPQLAVCLYHKNEDFYEIPLYLSSILSNYTFKFAHQYLGVWDSILYAIPNELYNSNQTSCLEP